MLTLEQAEALCGKVYEVYHVKLRTRVRQMFEQRRQSLQLTVSQTAGQQLVHSNRCEIFPQAQSTLDAHALRKQMEPAVMNGSIHTARKQHKRICAQISMLASSMDFTSAGRSRTSVVWKKLGFFVVRVSVIDCWEVV